MNDNLVDKLTEIQNEEVIGNVEKKLKSELHITRQQLRHEERRMRKEKRSEMKKAAMSMRKPGGAASIRELPTL